MEEARQRARQHTFLLWTSSVLHWFLLAGFITLFFWYRSHDPKIPPATAPPPQNTDTSPLEGIGATTTDAEQEGAEQVGQMLGSGCIASAPMVAYFRQLDAITNAATNSRNAQKRWTTIGIVIALGVMVVALMAWGKYKVGITKGAWTTMWLYSLVLFVIFCIFELFFFNSVIKKYWSMGPVQQACVFVESLDAQVKDLMQTVSVPQSQADAGDPPLPKMPTMGVVLLRNFMQRSNNPALVAAMALLLGRTGLPL